MARGMKRAPAQLAAGLLDEVRRGMGEQRGQGMPPAPRLSGNSRAGDADLALHLVVERLQLLEGDRPAAEVLAVHAEEVAAHVHRAAAHAAGDPAVRAALGKSVAARHQMRIAGRVGDEVVAAADRELVVEEVLGGVVRAAFQHEDAQAGAREGPGRSTAARARADDASVEDLSGHGARPACAGAARGSRSRATRPRRRTRQAGLRERREGKAPPASET